MTKPTTKPEFATDGSALLADPGIPKRHAGFVVDEAIPAHWLNWLLKNNSDWVEYLANLNGEPEFLNKSYQWTGSHGFKVSIGAFGAFVLGGTSNEVIYGDDQGVTTPRLRTKMIPLHNAVAKIGASTSWGCVGPTVANRGGITSTGPDDTMLLSFTLPDGSKLIRVRLGVNGHGSAIDAGIHQLRASLTPPYLNSGTALSSDTKTFTADGLMTLDTSGTSLVTNGALDVFQVEFTSHDVAQLVTFIEVQFLDPGPRNF